jgi:biotin carboxyl carrier protein
VSRVTKFEGDVVEAGAVLARVESAELGEAQAAVSMLDAERHAAELNAERETKLAERSLTTARELELASVEAKKANLLLGAAQQKVTALGGNSRPGHDLVLGAHEVRSPIAGTVVGRNVAPGQFVEGQLVAFKVADLDHLWIELDVFERNTSALAWYQRHGYTPLFSRSFQVVDLTEVEPLGENQWEVRTFDVEAEITDTGVCSVVIDDVELGPVHLLAYGSSHVRLRPGSMLDPARVAELAHAVFPTRHRLVLIGEAAAPVGTVVDADVLRRLHR